LVLLCWGGYTWFASYRADRADNISTVLSQLRLRWMSELIARDVRIADITSIGILQRTVTFFASTTILILAGLLAALGASDKVIMLANSIPLIAEHTRLLWELKLILLIFMYVYAFFKFSWSVRQYNFSLVILGAAPEKDSKSCQNFILQANEQLTSANNSFNFGLRTYTFSMAVIAWLVDPILFVLCSSWVVAILYRREFKSKTLFAMKSALSGYQAETQSELDKK
jgi:uncharacterized membrane protein